MIRFGYICDGVRRNDTLQETYNVKMSSLESPVAREISSMDSPMAFRFRAVDNMPSARPSANPSARPSANPSARPSASPFDRPSVNPSSLAVLYTSFCIMMALRCSS